MSKTILGGMRNWHCRIERVHRRRESARRKQEECQRDAEFWRESGSEEGRTQEREQEEEDCWKAGGRLQWGAFKEQVTELKE